MLLTRSSKKILITAGVVLIVFYLMYRGELSQVTSRGVLSTLHSIGTSPETVVDCPKTESMSKKTSMISSVKALVLLYRMCPFWHLSQDGTLFEYDRQSPLIFIGGVPRSGGKVYPLGSSKIPTKVQLWWEQCWMLTKTFVAVKRLALFHVSCRYLNKP